MIGYKWHIGGFFLIPFFLVLLELPAFTQTKTIHGIIRDNQSSEPVSNVNIKVNGTSAGGFSDQDGRFSLTVKKFPVSLTLSCIGYEPLYYDITKIPLKTIELILKRSISSLQEVEIRSTRFEHLFMDRNYSILDYELMDDNLLLMVFRYQLKKTELILLSRDGDTISVSPVPELKPLRLFKDFLGNVHYISTRETAYQIVYIEATKKMEFPYVTTYEALITKVKPFLFTTDDRVYFEEFTADGFGKNIGFYDNDNRKEYIRFYSGMNARKQYYDDLRFNARWNSNIEGPASFSNDDYRANKLFHYKKINAPIVKLRENNMATFNFTDGVIELMNHEGKIYSTVPIEFHKETNGNLIAGLLSVFVPIADWEWSGKLYVDAYYRDVYTSFTKKGMCRIRKIDLETGQLTRTFDIPVPFPEKIEIYQGECIFPAPGSRRRISEKKACQTQSAMKVFTLTTASAIFSC